MAVAIDPPTVAADSPATTATATAPPAIPVGADPRGFFTLDVPVVVLLVVLWREIWGFRQDLRTSITHLDGISTKLADAVERLSNQPPDKRDKG